MRDPIRLTFQSDEMPGAAVSQEVPDLEAAAGLCVRVREALGGQMTVSVETRDDFWPGSNESLLEALGARMRMLLQTELQA